VRGRLSDGDTCMVDMSLVWEVSGVRAKILNQHDAMSGYR
jgi:hypothetical protein